MVTGGKLLMLFKSMIMKSRIKISHFYHELFSNIQCFFRKTFTSSIFKSFSDFNHDFGMFFFYCKKWLQKWEKIIQSFSTERPTINTSIKCFFRCPSICIFRTSSKMFSKPIDKNNIARSNFYKYMPLLSCTVFSLFYLTNVEASFSINNSGQISDFSRKLTCFENSFSSHKKDPFFYYSTIINEENVNIQPERLSETTLFGMRKSELQRKPGEEKSKNFSRLEFIGHKSNSLVLNEAAARLGQSLRETEDQLIRDMLEATASIVNCVAGVNGDNPTEVVRADVDGVVATLQNNDAEFISEMIGGENKFGTGPVRDAYFAMADSNMIGQLENVAGFINKAQYPNDAGTLSSEWGSIGNVRFFLSSRGSLTAAASLLGADVYNMFITGQEAYCNIELDGASAQFIYHPPGWGDDPCELRQTAGYRFAYATRITNDAWVINLRATLA